MFRILLTFGGVILDLVSILSDGAMAAAMVTAGMIMTLSHLTLHSSPFRSLVDHLTGCDLPESPNPTAIPAHEERCRRSI